MTIDMHARIMRYCIMTSYLNHVEYTLHNTGRHAIEGLIEGWSRVRFARSCSTPGRGRGRNGSKRVSLCWSAVLSSSGIVRWMAASDRKIRKMKMQTAEEWENYIWINAEECRWLVELSDQCRMANAFEWFSDRTPMLAETELLFIEAMLWLKLPEKL